jgi:hypothetical protein
MGIPFRYSEQDYFGKFQLAPFPEADKPMDSSNRSATGQIGLNRLSFRAATEPLPVPCPPPPRPTLLEPTEEELNIQPVSPTAEDAESIPPDASPRPHRRLTAPGVLVALAASALIFARLLHSDPRSVPSSQAASRPSLVSLCTPQWFSRDDELPYITATPLVPVAEGLSSLVEHFPQRMPEELDAEDRVSDEGTRNRGESKTLR